MKPSYALFERFGVELEYMIVDARTLDVRPWADRLIRHHLGRVADEVPRGRLAWTNELALHLIEFKTAAPATRLDGLAARFQEEVRFVNAHLAADGARLLPTAMHPWMDPRRESRLWPHSGREIYAAFDRIFNCQGHGWTNLQAVHLNLPFADEDQFVRLHTAIRLLLPLLPALAASSPLVEGRRAPFLDTRLEVYRTNCARIPSITAAVVPEPITSIQDYREHILGRIYRDLAPLDPEGILLHEWTNARGAIARFERNTIEIRVIDLQECPAADLAILQAAAAVLRALTDAKLSSLKDQLAPATRDLAALLRRTSRVAGAARIANPAILRALGLPETRPLTAREAWARLLETCAPDGADWRPWIERILDRGTLSERILSALGQAPSEAKLHEVYHRLAVCLEVGEPFEPPPQPRPLPADPPAAPTLLLTCEHATARIPARWREVAQRAGSALQTHRGFDPGALELARRFSRRLGVPLLAGRCSRLLVDLNRGPGHPSLWSEYSAPLDHAEKVRVLRRFHLPHWRAAHAMVLREAQAGRPVLHLSVHTFTPELDGRKRNLDVGLLFDPRRKEEAALCRRWRRELRALLPELKVRFNAPYKGVSDGLATRLRQAFDGAAYHGIELEVNQRWPLGPARPWRQLQEALGLSFERACRATVRA